MNFNICRQFCSIKLPPMFKKARVVSRVPASNETVEDPLVTENKKHWGEQLRSYLLDKFCLEGMAGSDIAAISYLVTQAGGLGLEDLGVRPDLASKHGNEHVKLHAGKIYPDLDLAFVDCPMFMKRESRRCQEKVPIYLPSTMLGKFITEDMLTFNSLDSKEVDKVIGGLDNYDNHPIVTQAKLEGFQYPVRPLALYWDGVAYTNHDSFMAFYLTDILTSQKFLSFLIRTGLSCPHC